MRIRVWVTDVWDNLDLPVTPEYTFEQVKEEGLAATTGATVDASRYQVKYRGALITDEHRTLADAKVPDGAPMIILPANRRPVS